MFPQCCVLCQSEYVPSFYLHSRDLLKAGLALKYQHPTTNFAGEFLQIQLLSKMCLKYIKIGIYSTTVEFGATNWYSENAAVYKLSIVQFDAVTE